MPNSFAIGATRGDDGLSGRSGDHLDAQRARHLEPAANLGVGEVVHEAEVVGGQLNACGSELLGNLGEFVERDREPPRPQPLAVFRAVFSFRFLRLHMVLPELAESKPGLHQARDAVIERSIAKAIALGPELNTGNGALRCLDRSESRWHRSKAAYDQAVEFTASQIVHVGCLGRAVLHHKRRC